MARVIMAYQIGHHFLVVCLVTRPLNRNEARVDFVLIQTFMLTFMLFINYYVNLNVHANMFLISITSRSTQTSLSYKGLVLLSFTNGLLAELHLECMVRLATWQPLRLFPQEKSKSLANTSLRSWQSCWRAKAKFVSGKATVTSGRALQPQTLAALPLFADYEFCLCAPTGPPATQAGATLARKEMIPKLVYTLFPLIIAGDDIIILFLPKRGDYLRGGMDSWKY